MQDALLPLHPEEEGEGGFQCAGGGHGWTINHRPVDLARASRLIAEDP